MELKTYIAEYGSSYWEDGYKTHRVKAYSIDQAQALADIQSPSGYKLCVVYEPHFIRSLDIDITQYKVGDCFKINSKESEKVFTVFQIVSILKRNIKCQIVGTDPWIPSSCSKKYFANMWRSRRQNPPEQITAKEFNSHTISIHKSEQDPWERYDLRDKDEEYF